MSSKLPKLVLDMTHAHDAWMLGQPLTQQIIHQEIMML